jgi:hypothetical protein
MKPASISIPLIAFGVRFDRVVKRCDERSRLSNQILDGR